MSRHISMSLAQPDPVGFAAAFGLAVQIQVGMALVDREAEAARARFVTAGATKQAVYGQKAVEADRLAADASPDPAAYPLLAPEAAALGMPLTDLGATVRARRDAWLAVAGTIEGLCQTAKAALDAAGDEAAIRAATAIAWPAPA